MFFCHSGTHRARKISERFHVLRIHKPSLLPLVSAHRAVGLYATSTMNPNVKMSVAPKATLTVREATNIRIEPSISTAPRSTRLVQEPREGPSEMFESVGTLSKTQISSVVQRCQNCPVNKHMSERAEKPQTSAPSQASELTKMSSRFRLTVSPRVHKASGGANIFDHADLVTSLEPRINNHRWQMPLRANDLVANLIEVDPSNSRPLVFAASFELRRKIPTSPENSVTALRVLVKDWPCLPFRVDQPAPEAESGDKLWVQIGDCGRPPNPGLPFNFPAAAVRRCPDESTWSIAAPKSSLREAFSSSSFVENIQGCPCLRFIRSEVHTEKCMHFLGHSQICFHQTQRREAEVVVVVSL